MKTLFLIFFIFLFFPVAVLSQTEGEDNIWTLEDCIQYALKQNIQVRKSELINQNNQLYIEQARAQKLPSLSVSVHQNFSWSNRENPSTEESVFSGSNNTNYSVNSGISLFNRLNLHNRIKKARLDFESGLYNSETIKESVSLNILDAFLQVLFAEEQVKNSKKQVEATIEQLNLAEERLALSIISQSDYFQVKSQLASEKLTLANAQSQLAIARVNLMQLMELPVRDDFTISHPDLEKFMNQDRIPHAGTVFDQALAIKPQIKNAAFNKESAIVEEKIARSGYFPVLSFNAGFGTGYSSLTDMPGYFNQLNNQVNPTLGFTLSIPVFQNNQVKTSVSSAKIGIRNAELSETDVKNQLRKEIEQACVDVTSAQIEYEASLEQYRATEESYALATEKFEQGLINSVDYLFEKTNQIVAESQLLQSKYNLIFSYKVLDFYTGVPLTL